MNGVGEESAGDFLFCVALCDVLLFVLVRPAWGRKKKEVTIGGSSRDSYTPPTPRSYLRRI